MEGGLATSSAGRELRVDAVGGIDGAMVERASDVGGRIGRGSEQPKILRCAYNDSRDSA